MPFSGKDIGDILMALSTLVAAISAAGISIYNAIRLNVADAERRRLGDAINVQTKKVEEIHSATNSMKDELVNTTAAISHTAGVVEGRAVQVKEDAAAVAAAVDRKEAVIAEVKQAVQEAQGVSAAMPPAVPGEKPKPKT